MKRVPPIGGVCSGMLCVGRYSHVDKPLKKESPQGDGGKKHLKWEKIFWVKKDRRTSSWVDLIQ